LPSLPGAIDTKNEAKYEQKLLFLINDTFSKIITFLMGPPPSLKGKNIDIEPGKSIIES
jgi:hypothetical protein